MIMNSATLEALAIFPQQLEKFYDAIPEGFKQWAPSSWEGIPSEKFTAIEQICHVRDIEIDGYHSRFQRTLNEVYPTLQSVDGYSLAKQRVYRDANAKDVFIAFRSARAATVKLLS